MAQYIQEKNLNFVIFSLYCIHILQSLHLGDRQSIASDLNLGPLHVNPRCSLVRNIFDLRKNNQIHFYCLQTLFIDFVFVKFIYIFVSMIIIIIIGLFNSLQTYMSYNFIICCGFVIGISFNCHECYEINVIEIYF